MGAIRPAAWTFAVTSLRNAAPICAASSAVSSPCSRVFTWPGRGAFAMTAIAQTPSSLKFATR